MYRRAVVESNSDEFARGQAVEGRVPRTEEPIVTPMAMLASDSSHSAWMMMKNRVRVRIRVG